MKKVMICLIGCFLLALTTLRAQDTARPDSTRSSMDTSRSSMDTTKQTQGSSVISRDTVATPSRDTTIQVRDTTMQIKDTVISLADDPAPKQDTTIYASSKKDKQDQADTPPAKYTSSKQNKAEETTRHLGTRWFISPLLRVQFQDFAMFEKNPKGYFIYANT